LQKTDIRIAKTVIFLARGRPHASKKMSVFVVKLIFFCVKLIPANFSEFTILDKIVTEYLIKL